MRQHSISEFKIEKLTVKIYPDAQKSVIAAAWDTREAIKSLLREQKQVTILMQAVPAKQEFCEDLFREPDLDWTRVVFLFTNEFSGLPENAIQNSGTLMSRFLSKGKKFKEIFFMNDYAQELTDDCRRYEKILKKNPVDIACIDIGGDGHIAFNEPNRVDIDDKESIRRIELSDIIRQYFVNEKLFANFSKVPEHGITLTIPAIMKAKIINCTVSSRIKVSQLERALKDRISNAHPASPLRNHHSATIYLDSEIAGRLHIN